MKIIVFRAVKVAALLVAPLAGSWYLYCALGGNLKNSKSDTVLRVAHPKNHPIDAYDTAKVDAAPQAELLSNIYSRLIEYDSSDQIQGSIASNFFWDDDELVFEIRSDLTTIDKIPITAEDVLLSLKRLLALNTNTHGYLDFFVCDSVKTTNIRESCKGIRKTGNQIRVTVRDPRYKKYMLPLFAGYDYGIIPKSSIDWASEELKIIDYKNTSGPYYVDSSNKDGEITLLSNSYHYNYHPKMPHLVELVPSNDKNPLKMLVEDKVDFVTDVNEVSVIELKEVLETYPDRFKTWSTLPTQTVALFFLRKAQVTLSREQRIFLGNEIKKAFVKHYQKKLGFSEDFSFFPPQGEAGLSIEQSQKIEKMWANAKKTTIPGKIQLATIPSEIEEYKQIFGHIENLEIVELKPSPWRLSLEQQHEMFISPTDASFYEDYSLLSYNVETELFGMSKEDGKNWLRQYIVIDDKEARLKILRQLHYDLLDNISVVPIGRTPFTAIFSNRWNAQFSKAFPGNPLWKIRKN